jgi:hypothetical protein
MPITDRPILQIDRTYRNGQNNWKHPDDVFNRMFHAFNDGKGIQNSGGFRFKSKSGPVTNIENAAFVLLVSNFTEAEWPDSFDPETGLFTYYGDNRKPGHGILETKIGGNRLLDKVFRDLHTSRRDSIPPFLIFQSLKIDNSAFMRFIGLAAPGAPSLTEVEDLVAVWRMYGQQRFQNYRSVFSILDEPTVPWAWLDDLVAGAIPEESQHCPPSWKRFVKTGRPVLLQARAEFQPRSVDNQKPHSPIEQEVLNELLQLTDREFEFATAELIKLMDKRYVDLEVTPAVVDKGRDVTGFFLLGHDWFQTRFSVLAEAKQWRNTIGVKPMSRLISRLRHKDIGIFVTTSHFHKQVQIEIHEDQRKIILISGGDAARILISREIAGRGRERNYKEWLENITALAKSEIG